MHVFPPIDAACATADDVAAVIDCKASGSGTETGSIPVNATAPAVTV